MGRVYGIVDAWEVLYEIKELHALMSMHDDEGVRLEYKDAFEHAKKVVSNALRLYILQDDEDDFSQRIDETMDVDGLLLAFDQISRVATAKRHRNCESRVCDRKRQRRC